MTKKVLVADLFCGAGGSSTGASRALRKIGLEMDLVCVNHWPVAIDTHQKNHPEARHYCQDIATVRPSEVVPGGRLDLLMASPTCTYHSRARGGKPTSDQQRMDPWHIITWLTELRVKCLICENVPEFKEWGPVNPRTGKPMKTRKGEYFRSWVRSIEALGYKVEWRVLNAADFGDATTRQRFFLMARSDGLPITWPAPSHSRHGADLANPELRKWRPAREIIDWSVKGKSIFGRKKPLSQKTLERIYAGAVKFGWPEHFLVVLRNHMDGKPITGPLPAVTAGGTHIGLAEVVRVDPFLLSGHAGGAPRSDGEPMPGMTAQNNGPVLIAPYYSSGSGKTCGSVEAPLPTVTTKGRLAMVAPITHSGGKGRARDIEDPAPTICAGGRINLVEPARDFDILFRMLEPHELAGAMGFSDAESAYEFVGTKTDKVKQIGNAVPVNTASALVGAMMGDTAARRLAA